MSHSLENSHIRRLKTYEEYMICQLDNLPCIFEFGENKWWLKLRTNLFCILHGCDYALSDYDLLAPMPVEDLTTGCREMLSPIEFIRRVRVGKNGLYAKDWHLLKSLEEFRSSLPIFFLDDWLNWYWLNLKHGEDDFSFVYAGTQNTFTGVHHDVCCRYKVQNR